jgi:hypothetical protein
MWPCILLLIASASSEALKRQFLSLRELLFHAVAWSQLPLEYAQESIARSCQSPRQRDILGKEKCASRLHGVATSHTPPSGTLPRLCRVQIRLWANHVPARIAYGRSKILEAAFVPTKTVDEDCFPSAGADAAAVVRICQHVQWMRNDGDKAK